MKPIEPGCLAIIINSFNPINIGKTVYVKSYVKAGSPITTTDGLVGPSPWSGWLVQSQEDLISTDGFASKEAIYEKENWLMRIGDDSVQDVLKKAIENVE